MVHTYSFRVGDSIFDYTIIFSSESDNSLPEIKMFYNNKELEGESIGFVEMTDVPDEVVVKCLHITEIDEDAYAVLMLWTREKIDENIGLNHIDDVRMAVLTPFSVIEVETCGCRRDVRIKDDGEAVIVGNFKCQQHRI